MLQLTLGPLSMEPMHPQLEDCLQLVKSGTLWKNRSNIYLTRFFFIVILVPTIGCRPCSSLLPSGLHVKFQLMLKFMCSYNWIVFTYLLCCLQCFDTVGWVVGCWRGYLSGSEVQTCIWPSWCHCHSLSLASVKSRLVLPFWYRLTRIVPEKGPLNVCVCVTYFAWYCSYQNSRWEHCELFVEQ